MTPNPQRAPRSGARRAARIAVAAGLVAALSAAGPLPSAFSADSEPVPADAAVKSADEKLGSADADLLVAAKASGAKNVTMMIATAPGATEQVKDQLDAVQGGSVARTHDKLGYVRATVPTAKAEAAIAAAGKLRSVHGIDLRHEIELDDPSPSGGAKGTSGKRSPAPGSYPAPGRDTPAKNPYNPSFETGAVDFVQQNPKADGRGVTIGVIDSGVDLGHPSLQKTTTGERKIVDWVTATDPILDSDGTWRRMTNPVTGPDFTWSNTTWTAPAGSYQISTFRESVTANGDAKGDLNRDGDTTDVWALLYDPAAGTVRVDLNNNQNFTDDSALKPYKDGFQVGYFGTDDPATAIAERVPFVIEIRKDVPTDPYGGDWVGKKADFVNIGIIEGDHGTHVAGIAAANSLFGGKMNGAAPGAKVVSSRACSWSGGCTNIALTEGMIDLVVNRGVDIVNMSIGGLPALNDGNNARAELYTRLIDTYGVQLVIAAGNDGPGVNTIGDPGLASKVVSVGATISKETWAANYGSGVRKSYAMIPFSSRGPREDGGFAPVISAPGAAINTTQTWTAGGPVAEAGYQLPPGYSMLQGTSMASPQAAGASALLLSAAKQRGIDLTPAKLRTALTSTTKEVRGEQAHAQGTGLLDVVGAWKSIRRGATAHEYSVKAPVDTNIDWALKDPGFGTGLYDREGGLKKGERKTYDVVVTRTSGPDRPVRHELDLENNHENTFRIVGDDEVLLPLNKPVTVKVQARPVSGGVHSAILEVDDERTEGVDHQIMSTVVVSTPIAKPSSVFSASGVSTRNSHQSYFVTVPEGAKSLEVKMSGLAAKSQTRFITLHPYGVQMEDSSTIFCYPNYEHPLNQCRPDVRSYLNPTPGVWEIEVESRRTSPLLDNPFKLDATVLGASFDPATQSLPEAKVGVPAPVSWKVTNNFAKLEGALKGGPLGSTKAARPTIAHHDSQEYRIVVPAGAARLDASVGNVSDAAADLDLALYNQAGTLVASAADGDSEEAVSVRNPAPGEYRVVIDGYSVPAGSTAYDYLDLFVAPSLGSITVDETKRFPLGLGSSVQVPAEVVANSSVAADRQLQGDVQLVNERGSVTGVGSVRVDKVVP
ncbi:S8 family serine peptidase [Streptomyces uncialis]|uniref:S8 family serine peptidase n=1 Tax=Streptomyces uncialis TaxID=1048205 RepID=UPI00379838A8|nr:S8 family serine peptidase [Streptomyces uncialis]